MIYAASYKERARFALSVEKLIANAVKIGRERRIATAQFEDTDEAADFPIWIARLVFVVTYHVNRQEPDVIIETG